MKARGLSFCWKPFCCRVYSENCIRAHSASPHIPFQDPGALHCCLARCGMQKEWWSFLSGLSHPLHPPARHICMDTDVTLFKANTEHTHARAFPATFSTHHINQSRHPATLSCQHWLGAQGSLWCCRKHLIHYSTKWQTSNPASTCSDRFNSSSNHATSASCKIPSNLFLQTPFPNRDNFSIFK